jgi:hypothetical protein
MIPWSFLMAYSSQENLRPRTRFGLRATHIRGRGSPEGPASGRPRAGIVSGIPHHGVGQCDRAISRRAFKSGSTASDIVDHVCRSQYRHLSQTFFGMTSTSSYMAAAASRRLHRN